MVELYEDFEAEGTPPKWAETGPIKNAFFGSPLSFDTSPEDYEDFEDEFTDVGSLKTTFSGSALQFDTTPENYEDFEEGFGDITPYTADSNDYVLGHLDETFGSAGSPRQVAITNSANASWDGEASGIHFGDAPSALDGNAIYVTRPSSPIIAYPDYNSLAFPSDTNWWLQGQVEVFFKPADMDDLYHDGRTESWGAPGYDRGYFFRLAPNNGTTAGLYVRLFYFSSMLNLETNWTWNSTSYIRVQSFNPANYFATDSWTQILVTWDANDGANGAMYTYLNGEQMGTDTWENTGPPDNNGFALHVGSYGPGAFTRCQVGYYDEVRYSNIVR